MRGFGRHRAARKGCEANPCLRGDSAEAGTTLLEILVVAGILLVGILAVIRVFPIGFDVVERGGYTTIANRYAQSLLDDLRSRPGALPDGIIPAVYLGTTYGGTRWWVNDNTLTPVDLEGVAPSAGDGGLRAFKNSLVQCRRIYQETTRVPRASISLGGASVSRYALRFAPIEFYGDPTSTSGWYDLMTVYSLSPYVKVDKGDLSRYDGRDGYYAIDPDDEDPERANEARKIYFSKVGYKRTFKIDYALRPVNAVSNDYNPDDVQYTTDSIVWVEADADVATNAGGAEVVLGNGSSLALAADSEVVRRRLIDELSGEAYDSSDAYRYRLVDKTVGVLQFDERTAGMPIGITYSVMDWGILHDDVDVPLAADASQVGLATAEDRLAWVKLSFPFIDRTPIGAQQETDGGGTVTVKGDGRPGMQFPIIIQNIDPNSQYRSATDAGYGSLIDPSNNNDGASDGKATWTFTDPIRGTDGSLAGRLGLRVSKFQTLNGGQGVRRIRIFYRSTDGFSAQVVKPFASYMPAPAGTTVPAYNRYRSSGARLYFALSDVGKSVAVDYSYQDAADASQRRVAGEMHTIGTVRTTLDAGVGPHDYGFVDLNVPGSTNAIRSVDAVRGMSLEVRVLWPKRGVPCRMYKILQTGWGGGTPAFWEELQEGRMLEQGVSAAVAKPQDL